jgi:hypothetical protein
MIGYQTQNSSFAFEELVRAHRAADEATNDPETREFALQLRETIEKYLTSQGICPFCREECNHAVRNGLVDF